MTEASWLGPNATPYQAVGPSAQKRPHENGKCPGPKKATWKWKVSTPPRSPEGSPRGWKSWDQHIYMGLLNDSLDFPLENHNDFQQTPFLTRCRAQSTESYQVMSCGPLSKWAAGRCEYHVCLHSHSALGLVSDNRRVLLSRISSPVILLIQSVSTRSLPDWWLTCIPSEFLLLRIQTSASQGLGIISLHLFNVLTSQEDFVEFYIL